MKPKGASSGNTVESKNPDDNCAKKGKAPKSIIELQEQWQKKERRKFIDAFKLLCSTFTTQYFYPCKSNNYKSIRQSIIDQNRHLFSKTKLQDSVTILALSIKADELLATLPCPLKDIAKKLVGKRAKARRINNRLMAELYHWSLKYSQLFVQNVNTLAQYYIIGTDIQELKHLRIIAKTKLRAYEAFPTTCPGYTIVKWHTELVPLVVQTVIFFVHYP